MGDFSKWLKVREAYYDQQGFWAGEGGGASGVLPIARSTARLCFAWRSRNVHMGNSWGTLGGAVLKGMNPAQSAIEEMKEETGYSGSIDLKPAYIFSKGSFKYHNFVGIVPEEFEFAPEGGHSWETDNIEWFDYKQAIQQLNRAHPGLVALFQNSKDLIEGIVSKLSKNPNLSQSSAQVRQ